MMESHNKRTIHYSFKASEAESDRIREKMKAAGISNQSAYIRAMAMNGYVLKLDLPELHQAVRLLGSLSSNVNHIARRMNEHGSIYDTELDEIADKQNQILGVMNQILSRLNPAGG